VKSFPACVVPPIPEKHRMGALGVETCQVTETDDQNTSRETGSRLNSLKGDD
jgi:hypothetical protein